ncbi:DUF3019 domain-containing protein [Aliikangiella marina]|uniref:DUF3019 domain-containing protein n=1 Tax=Aliikangiella marina TaxID=1712262 RepID=A0A545TD21_9GAMM|nr:DUF3019 domain-containing protein [Aliikangiella marina]TQV75118.1 DUF3019 domain-containing protein [Aliikangiella marina]
MLTGLGGMFSSFIEASSPSDEYGLYLSPNLCLMSSEEKTCEINIHVRWQTKSNANYCLYKAHESTPLECWADNNSGTVYVDFSINDNLTLILKEQSTNAIIYQQIVRLQREIKRYRRSRRNPWRFY